MFIKKCTVAGINVCILVNYAASERSMKSQVLYKDIGTK